MKFEDLHEFGGTHFYAVPNESLEAWEELLQGLPVYRAAGICSGGEVGLFSLLPHTRSSLTLVDHSYKSIYFAMVKYLALQKYGAEETYKRITQVPRYDRTRAFETLAHEFDEAIPAPVHKAWESSSYSTPRGPAVFNSRGHYIKELWQRLPQERLVKACPKLDRVTFVHGDLTDLKGKFNLLYLSNALEHVSRTREHPLVDKVHALVKPGGFVLMASQRYYNNTRPKQAHESWELVKQANVSGGSHSSEMGWLYSLFQTPEAVAA